MVNNHNENKKIIPTSKIFFLNQVSLKKPQSQPRAARQAQGQGNN
jgi:hypothetical protein